MPDDKVEPLKPPSYRPPPLIAGATAGRDRSESDIEVDPELNTVKHVVFRPDKIEMPETAHIATPVVGKITFNGKHEFGKDVSFPEKVTLVDKDGEPVTVSGPGSGPPGFPVVDECGNTLGYFPFIIKHFPLEWLTDIARQHVVDAKGECITLPDSAEDSTPPDYFRESREVMRTFGRNVPKNAPKIELDLPFAPGEARPVREPKLGDKVVYYAEYHSHLPRTALVVDPGEDLWVYLSVGARHSEDPTRGYFDLVPHRSVKADNDDEFWDWPEGES